MSTALPSVTLPDGSIKTTRRLTYREARYVSARLRGDVSQAEAARIAGFPAWMASSPGRELERGEVAALIEELRGALAQHAVECALVDAAELHEQLSDEVRGDLADLYKDGELLPVDQWPRWARLGGVEVLDEPNMVHSADGAEGSWDQVGRRIKIKAGSRHKSRELLAKLKVVDALVKQAPEAGEIAGAVMSAIDARIAEGRKRAAQRIESGDIIDVAASPARDVKS